MKQKILIRSSFVSYGVEQLQRAVTEKMDKLINQKLRQTENSTQR